MDILILQFNDVLYSSAAVVNIDCTDLKWEKSGMSRIKFSSHHFASSNLSDTDVELSKHMSSH